MDGYPLDNYDSRTSAVQNKKRRAIYFLKENPLVCTIFCSIVDIRKVVEAANK